MDWGRVFFGAGDDVSAGGAEIWAAMPGRVPSSVSPVEVRRGVLRWVSDRPCEAHGDFWCRWAAQILTMLGFAHTPYGMLDMEMMDVRTFQRHISKGEITHKEFQDHLDSLPDLTDSADRIDYDKIFLAEESSRAQAGTQAPLAGTPQAPRPPVGLGVPGRDPGLGSPKPPQRPMVTGPRDLSPSGLAPARAQVAPAETVSTAVAPRLPSKLPLAPKKPAVAGPPPGLRAHGAQTYPGPTTALGVPPAKKASPRPAPQRSAPRSVSSVRPSGVSPAGGAAPSQSGSGTPSTLGRATVHPGLVPAATNVSRPGGGPDAGASSAAASPGPVASASPTPASVGAGGSASSAVSGGSASPVATPGSAPPVESGGVEAPGASDGVAQPGLVSTPPASDVGPRSSLASSGAVASATSPSPGASIPGPGRSEPTPPTPSPVQGVGDGAISTPSAPGSADPGLAATATTLAEKPVSSPGGPTNPTAPSASEGPVEAQSGGAPTAPSAGVDSGGAMSPEKHGENDPEGQGPT